MRNKIELRILYRATRTSPFIKVEHVERGLQGSILLRCKELSRTHGQPYMNNEGQRGRIPQLFPEMPYPVAIESKEYNQDEKRPIFHKNN